MPHTNKSQRDAVAEGINALVDSMDSGYLSEEQGTYLIKLLVAAYMGDVITQRVSGYLESGFQRLLEQPLQERMVLG